METTLNQKNIKGILILFIMVSGIFSLGIAKAQRPPRGYSFANYYRGAGVFKLAVEGGISTRSFKIKSDIDAINQLEVVQEGWSASVLLGGKNMDFRAVYGKYNTSSTVEKKVGQQTFGGQVSVRPLSILGIKSKYFQPYIIGGIEVSSVTFSGNYIPAPKKPLLPAGQNQCQCQCDAGTDGTGLPADPDMVDAPQDTQDPSGPPNNPNAYTQPDPDIEPVTAVAEPRVDKLLATQAITGIGLDITFKSGNRFYSMFSEARYGIPLGVEPLTAPLVYTTISGQVALYFGIRIGLSN